MHAGRWLWLITVMVFAAMPAEAAKTIVYYDSECCRDITQGEFAILYCQALGLREPAQGWSVQSAAAALSAMGHQPTGGWVLSNYLTEGAMSRLLRNSKLNRKPFNEPEFQRSTKPVTIANARSAVPADDAISQGEFAVLLARALNLPESVNQTPEAAVRQLLSLPIPLKPLAGWLVDAPLHESEMLEILAATPFRASSVDPTAEISALQAYSLLLGRFEIATEGHFGLYIVEALGVPPPAGGWSMKKALDYVEREFGIKGGYGVQKNTPLCADFFIDSLRGVLMKTWQTEGKARSAEGPAILRRTLQRASDPVAEQMGSAPFYGSSGAFTFAPLQGGKSSVAKDVEAFIKDVRSSGLLPSNRCQPIAAQGFSKAAQGPIGPVAGPIPPPAESPKPAPPASSSVPPPPELHD